MATVNFLTVFRSVPSGVTTPSVGGDCWAAGTVQPSLFREGKKWIEIEIFYHRLGTYQDDQDGILDGVGYNPDQDWYSFPVTNIVKWRLVDSSWRKGPAFAQYGKISKASREAKERAKAKERSKLIHNGVDYEAILRELDPSLALID